ncbi:hypothetical protein BASA81_012151 [Batrachochytrium salamandrivorans]|nr:hypothetical protein BASA81_012151 [Batrachochytrium salamandrivorans]
MRAVEFCLKLLQTYPDHEEVCSWAWLILRDAICVFDNENPREFVTVDLALEFGVLEEIIRELERKVHRSTCLGHAFSSLTTICLVERHALQVAQSGVARACVNVCHRQVSEELLTSALGSLKNLAMTSKCRQLLVDCGAVQVAESYVEAVASPVNSTLKLGLCACSLLVRLVGGSGWTEWLFYDRMLMLLRNVFKVGLRGTVIQSEWNPANIVLDLLLLVQCDENQPKLVGAIPLLINGLRLRGERNTRLVRFTVATLFHLYVGSQSNVELAHEFQLAAESVLHEMARVGRHGAGGIDLETAQMAHALKTEMQLLVQTE